MSEQVWSVVPVEPGSETYLEAKKLRYQALYGPWRLPRILIEDTDGRDYEHLVATVGKDVIGYGRIHLEVDPPQIYQVCVTDAWRGRGVGADIVRELMQIAAKHGATRVMLDARDYAIGFYENIGFEAYGETFLSGRTNTPHRKMQIDL